MAVCQSVTMTSAAGAMKTGVWSHVFLSAVVGGLLVPFGERSVIGLAYGGGAYATIQAAVVFAVFAAVGQAFSPQPHGWRQGLTALVWVPVVGWAFLGNPGDNDLGGTEPLTYAAGAAVAGIAALVMYEGRLRIAGSVLGVAIIAGTAVTLIHRDHVEDRAAAVAEFGSSVRPWVVGLDSYRQHGDPHVGDPRILWTTFYRPDQADRPDRFLTVTTDASTTVVCGDVLRADIAGGFGQPEKSCQQVDGVWRRTSEGGHEVALVKDDRVVRVAAANSVPERELLEALESVRPISDRYYRHALFGEDGEYIPELDGAR